MINYEILGRVTAGEGVREAKLTTYSQLMLAFLILAEGKKVPKSSLERALDSGGKEDPNRVKRTAHELHGQLSSALPIDALQSDGGGLYWLALEPEQADVLRFRAGLTRARGVSGPDHARLLHDALAEWPGAVGLHGGEPLSNLPGLWADSVRRGLQEQYYDAVMERIKQDMSDGRYEQVTRECGQIADDDPEALSDEEFVGKWMRAAYLSGDQARAERIFRRADKYMKSSKQKPTPALRDLNSKIQTKDPRLGRPVSPPDRAVAAVPETRNVPVVVPAPAYNLLRPVGDGTFSNERTAMSEPSISISIGDNAHIGNSIARMEGNITQHMEHSVEPPSAPAGDSEPDSTEREKDR